MTVLVQTYFITPDLFLHWCKSLCNKQ